MEKIIKNMRNYMSEQYSDLLKVDWLSLKNATQIVTSFIIFTESDEMKIEMLFLKLYETVSFLKNEHTSIADDLLSEFCEVYENNNNLLIALSAYLLTNLGSHFWLNCSEELKNYYIAKGWTGIVNYCNDSHIIVTEKMHQCFIQHLCSDGIDECNSDPYEFWICRNNDLSDIACRILSIPCSETPVERLFGGLSFMLDPTSSRMKSDLVNAEMTIRMSTVFQNMHGFDGNFLLKMQKCFEYFHEYAFPEVSSIL